MFVLDTHAWIWFVDGNDRRVGRASRKLIERAATRNALRIASMSLFELVALHTSGRLRLTQTIEDWIDDALEPSGVRVTELTREVAVDAGFIPSPALGDPVDRIVVATARQLEATLITADAAILAYAKETGNVRVQDLGR